jgi:peptidoglycan-associated lipoprotein
MRIIVRSLVVAAIGLAFAACGSPEPPPPAPAPAPQPAPRPAATVDDSAARARAAEAERQRREAELASLRTSLGEMVFFDYDRSEIRADARAILDRKARIMRDQPAIALRIEGHADERGSTEYNLALGSRRAEAVRAYLQGVGINASRVQATTYGEARPLSSGSAESAWSRNRRAEFAVTAGLAGQ